MTDDHNEAPADVSCPKCGACVTYAESEIDDLRAELERVTWERDDEARCRMEAQVAGVNLLDRIEKFESERARWRAVLDLCWAELATEHERNYPLPPALIEAMREARALLESKETT